MNYPKMKAYEGAPEGQKRCSKCREFRDLSDFRKRNDVPDGLRYDCNFCHKKRDRKRQERHPDIRRKNKYKLKYGITIQDYESLLKKQNNRCKICDTPISELKRKHLDVDHNHITGKVRGLLCNNCNRGIGYFKDNINILRKVINYLKDHGNED